LCDSCHAEVEKRGIKILQSGGHKRDVVRMTYRFLIEKRVEINGIRHKSLEENSKKNKKYDSRRL
jgi:hypothetical protein